MTFSKEARRKAHSPAARRKAVATIRRNRRLREKEIPLAAVPARRPYKRKPRLEPIEKQVQLTLVGRLAAAHQMALQIAELLS